MNISAAYELISHKQIVQETLGKFTNSMNRNLMTVTQEKFQTSYFWQIAPLKPTSGKPI